MFAIATATSLFELHMNMGETPTEKLHWNSTPPGQGGTHRQLSARAKQFGCGPSKIMFGVRVHT